MAEVGILVIDDDIASQRALKHILDSEGWRVRILPTANRALEELATGDWRLVIVNSTLIDLRGSLFSVLKALAQTEPSAAPETTPQNGSPDQSAAEPAAAAPRKGVRVLFLVQLLNAQETQAILEREELPYTIKPYHLHDFLEKVSELLVEAGAIAEPMRTMGGFSRNRTRRRSRTSRDAKSGAMFASREDYQVSDEEMTEFENEQDNERKKREKELSRMKDLGRP